jgi:hypothetical protein
MTGIAGALLICLIAISTASAYDADTACASLKEIIAGSNDLTALELVVEYTDGSSSAIKLWTDSVIDPEETLCTSVHRTIEMAGEPTNLSRVILSLVADTERVSYKLSPETSVFGELPEPVEFPGDLSFLQLIAQVRKAKFSAGLKSVFGELPEPFEFPGTGSIQQFIAQEREARFAERMQMSSWSGAFASSLRESTLASRVGTTTSPAILDVSGSSGSVSTNDPAHSAGTSGETWAQAIAERTAQTTAGDSAQAFRSDLAAARAEFFEDYSSRLSGMG